MQIRYVIQGYLQSLKIFVFIDHFIATSSFSFSYSVSPSKQTENRNTVLLCYFLNESSKAGEISEKTISLYPAWIKRANLLFNLKSTALISISVTHRRQKTLLCIETVLCKVSRSWNRTQWHQLFFFYLSSSADSCLFSASSVFLSCLPSLPTSNKLSKCLMYLIAARSVSTLDIRLSVGSSGRCSRRRA